MTNNRLLAPVLALCLAAAAHGAETGERVRFQAEFEGRVRVEGRENGGVLIVPTEGLPVRVENGSAMGGDGWDGRWAEIEGLIFHDNGEAVMRVREFSIEDGPPRRSGPPLEAEGLLLDDSGAAVLRTVGGDAPLAGYPGPAPFGARVEIEGRLAIRDGRLAIEVSRVERD